MYASGHGTSEIVQFLNQNHYLSPSGYRKTGLVKKDEKTESKWNEVTLCNMLKNEAYIGNAIQNKRTVVSYKVKKVRNVEREKQIRVNHTHEAIIDKEIFEKVQCILEKRGSNAKQKYHYLLRGLLYCHHCKRKLQIVLKKSSSGNAKVYPYIVCSNYKKRGCYSFHVNYDKLEKYIMEMIKGICKRYADKEYLKFIYQKYQEKPLCEKEEYKKTIEQINKKLLEIDCDLENMYLDKLHGGLEKEDYLRILQRINLERNKLRKEEEKIKEKMKRIEKQLIEIDNQKENKLKQVMEDFFKLEEIRPIYLYRLINKIEIDKEKKIYIFFNFSKLDGTEGRMEEFIKIEEVMKN